MELSGTSSKKSFCRTLSWIEPTVGLRYYIADYDSDAAALGLADGHVLRLQAGARLGTQFLWNNVVVTPILTGLVYGDATVSGLAVTDAAFLGSAGGVASAATEGKVRGQGIGAVKFDYGNGVSSFVQADIRGGSDYYRLRWQGWRSFCLVIRQTENVCKHDPCLWRSEVFCALARLEPVQPCC